MYEPLQLRSRPDEVEVVRLEDDNLAEVVAWVRAQGGAARVDDGLLVLGEGASEQVPMIGAVIVHRRSGGCFVAMSVAELEERFEPLAASGRSTSRP